MPKVDNSEMHNLHIKSLPDNFSGQDWLSQKLYSSLNASKSAGLLVSYVSLFSSSAGSKSAARHPLSVALKSNQWAPVRGG